jgi:hypothetical protein
VPYQLALVEAYVPKVDPMSTCPRKVRSEEPMADNDLSEEFKAVGEAVRNLARKANEISGDEIKTFIEAVKGKLNELEQLLDDQRAKHSRE